MNHALYEILAGGFAYIPRRPR